MPGSSFRKPLRDSTRNLRLIKNNTTLEAECQKADGKTYLTSRINLDSIIGNRCGYFQWGRKDISLHAENPYLHGTRLYAELRNPHGETTLQWIDLDDHLENEDGVIIKDEVPRPRTLVLCFDGTTNYFNDRNTNIVKFMSAIRRDDPDRQLVYYQPGIGTYSNPGIISPITQWVAKRADEAIAWYLDQHVMDGYQFLAESYKAGDKICIFGFSRGAYTARALAGMLNKVGLLPPNNREHIPFAFSMFKKDSKDCTKFRDTFSRVVDVEFLGVWDTVNSTGIFKSRCLPSTDSNPIVKTFRHALSLDERRVKFLPTLFTGRKFLERAASHAKIPSPTLYRGKKARKERVQQIPEEYQTDVEEVWFAGDHCDVGGGHVLDRDPEDIFDETVQNLSVFHAPDEKGEQRAYVDSLDSQDPEEAIAESAAESLRDLSSITLRWMVAQVHKTNTGILFDSAQLAKSKIYAQTDDIGYLLSVTPRARDEDTPFLTAMRHADTFADQHDSLRGRRGLFWWALELIPLKVRMKDKSGHEGWATRQNLGRGRVIHVHDGHPLKIHGSVRRRMEDKGYRPRATTSDGKCLVDLKNDPTKIIWVK